MADWSVWSYCREAVADVVVNCHLVFRIRTVHVHTSTHRILVQQRYDQLDNPVLSSYLYFIHKNMLIVLLRNYSKNRMFTNRLAEINWVFVLQALYCPCKLLPSAAHSRLSNSFYYTRFNDPWERTNSLLIFYILFYCGCAFVGDCARVLFVIFFFVSVWWKYPEVVGNRKPIILIWKISWLDCWPSETLLWVLQQPS